MKMKEESTMFRVLVGSRLYGTFTEKSDFDYKAVCLPDINDLLLNKKLVNRKQKPEGLSDSDKMLDGEDETEFLPLQVFFDDFFSGQSYALEVAFATAQGLHDVPSHDREEYVAAQELMKELLSKFLTNSVKKMAGYAISQSKLYGLKTERYASLNKVVSAIESNYTGPDTRLQDDMATVTLLTGFEHVKMSTIKNANGGLDDAPALQILDKHYPLTNKWSTVMLSLMTVVKAYGHRVKEFEGAGTDWKALSHAIRITEQVLELTTTGNLIFPRPNAKLLTSIKNGEMSLIEATDHLDDAFAAMDNAIANSILRQKTPELEAEFEAWKIKVLRKLYNVS